MTAKRKAGKAASAFKRFHGKAARIAVVQAPPLPRRVWSLGTLHSVVYKRLGDGELYEHKFRNPRPHLCADEKGRRLYVLAGGYRVTLRGIVG